MTSALHLRGIAAAIEIGAISPETAAKEMRAAADALELPLDGPNSGLTVLEKKVALFALLPDGWDSYGAKAFPKATIKLGMEMARKLGDEWKAVPCGNGSIEFYRNNEDEMVWVETTFDEEPTREQQ